MVVRLSVLLMLPGLALVAAVVELSGLPPCGLTVAGALVVLESEDTVTEMFCRAESLEVVKLLPTAWSVFVMLEGCTVEATLEVVGTERELG